MNILRQNFEELLPKETSVSLDNLNLFSELFSEYNPEDLRNLYKRLEEIWNQIKNEVEKIFEQLRKLPQIAYLLPLLTLSGCVPQPVEDFLNWVFSYLEGPDVTVPLLLFVFLHILGVIGDSLNIVRPGTQFLRQHHFIRNVYTFFDRVRNLSSRASIFRSSRRGRRISVGRRGFFINRWLRNVSEYLGNSPPLVRRLVNIVILSLILGVRTPFFNMIRSAIDSAQAWFGIPQAASTVAERVSKSPYIRVVTVKIEGVSGEIEKIVIEEEQENMLKALINRTGLSNFNKFYIKKRELKNKPTIQMYLRDLGALQEMGDISPYLIFMNYKDKKAYYEHLISQLNEEAVKQNPDQERLKKIKESAAFFSNVIKNLIRDEEYQLSTEETKILLEIQFTYDGIKRSAEELSKNPPQK